MNQHTTERSTFPRQHHRQLPPLPSAEAMATIDWDEILSRLDIAFQPIVNIHTGACYGYEALLRGQQEVGFASPQDVFDAAHILGVLPRIDLEIREKVIVKFASLPNRNTTKLFINLDNRTLGHSIAADDWTRLVLAAHDLPESTVTFEISERHPLGQATEAIAAFRALRAGGFRLAIDDFGTGFSGLQMLYFAEPDFLKIDRFFISDIASDARKKLFLSQIVNIAHLLGVVVVAEGVECEREYFICKEIGCDLVQGYLIQRPTTELGDLREVYEEVAELSHRDRRTVASDQRLITPQIDTTPPLSIHTSMEEVFERFRADISREFFAVVDEAFEPVGIIRERELKEYAYSRFGRDLMSNRGLRRSLRDFLVRCPVADVNAKAENILQTYAIVQSGDGIIMVDGRKYTGFLSAGSLLRIINEKNLAAAREQNPLTKLPGNNSIHQNILDVLEDVERECALVYFDFDNFKPFNDIYGFRLGDRAILLFAELMIKVLQREGRFIGHIGGDDFFAGFRAVPLAQCQAETGTLLYRFGSDVESFYDDETRRRGYISGFDRAGERRQFPLLGVSAAVLHLPAGRDVLAIDSVSQEIARLKKSAKASPQHMAIGTCHQGR